MRRENSSESARLHRGSKKRRMFFMAKQNVDNLNVTCPCCQAKLVVDSVFGAVLSHEAPVKAGPNVDLTDAAGILNEQQRNRRRQIPRFLEPGA